MSYECPRCKKVVDKLAHYNQGRYLWFETFDCQITVHFNPAVCQKCANTIMGRIAIANKETPK